MTTLGPIFLKLRTIAFSCIIFISFVWVILFFVELYVRWDVSQTTQRNLVLILSVVNAITTIMLLVLIILPFRIWLDAARLLFLLIAHIGPAAGFTVYIAKEPCPEDNPDEEGVCNVINTYIAIASWVVPLCLVVYAICLASAVYRRRNFIPEKGTSEKTLIQDEEKNITPRQSALPMMLPPPPSPFPFTDRRSTSSHRTSTQASTSDASSRMSRTSRPVSQRHISFPVPQPAAPAMPSPVTVTPIERQRTRTLSMPSIAESSVKSSGRLSKPVPQMVWEAI
ncbi:unnamed protein product [Somion occarium]|uniref:Uncharacterized protein n=1 Tax=Somion occarium TaxID=3059160 RepID=A0ABP1DAS0_9APHY